MDPVVLFYQVDEFCKIYDKEIVKFFLDENRKPYVPLKSSMTSAEIITIKILYHESGFKTFKDFVVRQNVVLLSYFPKLVSYSRLVELCIDCTLPLLIFAKMLCVKSDGIAFIDSTKLEVSHIKRASGHKTFAGIATKGHTAMGWFYGLKLHLLVNHRGEVIDFDITPGNIADNNASLLQRITKKFVGKIYGDRGYLINQNLFADLFSRGIHMISKVRKNMRERIMSFTDKILLKKRGIIESAIGVLKQSLNLEHSRHRNPTALFAHVASALVAYFFRPNKPSIDLPFVVIPG